MNQEPPFLETDLNQNKTKVNFHQPAFFNQDKKLSEAQLAHFKDVPYQDIVRLYDKNLTADHFQAIRDYKRSLGLKVELCPRPAKIDSQTSIPAWQAKEDRINQGFDQTWQKVKVSYNQLKGNKKASKIALIAGGLAFGISSIVIILNRDQEETGQAQLTDSVVEVAKPIDPNQPLAGWAKIEPEAEPADLGPADLSTTAWPGFKFGQAASLADESAPIDPNPPGSDLLSKMNEDPIENLPVLEPETLIPPDIDSQDQAVAPSINQPTINHSLVRSQLEPRPPAPKITSSPKISVSQNPQPRVAPLPPLTPQPQPRVNQNTNSTNYSSYKIELMTAVGISPADWPHVDFILTKESGWRHLVWNYEGSGAYGALPVYAGS